jgi:hypothetical protein
MTWYSLSIREKSSVGVCWVAQEVLWVIFLGLILLFVTIVSYIFFLYYSIGYLSAYITGLLTFFATFSFLIYWYNMFGYTLHVHHWFLGAFMQCVMCYQNGFITAIQAIFGGVMTEGASRWGYDPLFNIESNMGEKQAFVMTKFAQSQARLKNHEIGEHKIAAAESMGAPLINPPVFSYQPQPIATAPINY